MNKEDIQKICRGFNNNDLLKMFRNYSRYSAQLTGTDIDDETEQIFSGIEEELLRRLNKKEG